VSFQVFDVDWSAEIENFPKLTTDNSRPVKNDAARNKKISVVEDALVRDKDVANSILGISGSKFSAGIDQTRK
jgi:hypothetical protein